MNEHDLKLRTKQFALEVIKFWEGLPKDDTTPAKLSVANYCGQAPLWPQIIGRFAVRNQNRTLSPNSARFWRKPMNQPSGSSYSSTPENYIPTKLNRS